MSFDEGDKAIIREIAWEVASHIEERLKASIESGLYRRVEIHALSCPVKDDVKSLQDRIQGAWWVVGLIATIVGSIAAIAVELIRK